MNKLNFGCGKRFAPGWTNIDFHSDSDQIQRVNLLKGFPFADEYFDVVYSSHVLEHFTPDQALFLLKEAWRVLKPQGILRISVPDLEGICREYLRVLSLPDTDPQKADQHEWIVVELLDQLVRSFTFGEMGEFYIRLNNTQNPDLKAYVQSRIGQIPLTDPVTLPWRDRFRQLTPQRIATQLNYAYLKLVSQLIPPHLRSMVFVETSIGERHRWMYDTYGLQRTLEKAGFQNCQPVAYNQSNIVNFAQDLLDRNPDGSEYKVNSIYLEAQK